MPTGNVEILSPSVATVKVILEAIVFPLKLLLDSIEILFCEYNFFVLAYLSIVTDNSADEALRP